MSLSKAATTLKPASRRPSDSPPHPEKRSIARYLVIRRAPWIALRDLVGWALRRRHFVRLPVVLFALHRAWVVSQSRARRLCRQQSRVESGFGRRPRPRGGERLAPLLPPPQLRAFWRSPREPA